MAVAHTHGWVCPSSAPILGTLLETKMDKTANANHPLDDSLCLSMLLSTLETTIVSTSLVSIVNDLQGFDQTGWVITSYFLTYTGE